MDFSKYSSEEINNNYNLAISYYKLNTANNEDIIFIKKRVDKFFNFLDEKLKQKSSYNSFLKKDYKMFLFSSLVNASYDYFKGDFNNGNEKVVADIFFDTLREKFELIKEINQEKKMEFWLNCQLNGLSSIISNCLVNCSIEKLSDNILLLKNLEDLIDLGGKKIDNLYVSYNKKYYMDAINLIDFEKPDSKQRINLIYQEKYKKYSFINLYLNQNLEKIKFLEKLGLKFEFYKYSHILNLNYILNNNVSNFKLFQEDYNKYIKKVEENFKIIEYALSKLENKKSIIKKYNKIIFSYLDFQYNFLINRRGFERYFKKNYNFNDAKISNNFEKHFVNFSLKQIKTMEEFINLNMLIKNISNKNFSFNNSILYDDREYILNKMNNKTFFVLKQEDENKLKKYFGENAVQKKNLLININKERKKNNLNEVVKKRRSM